MVTVSHVDPARAAESRWALHRHKAPMWRIMGVRWGELLFYGISGDRCQCLGPNCHSKGDHSIPEVEVL